MTQLSSLPRMLRWGLLTLAALVLLAIVVPVLVTPWLGGRVHAFARTRAPFHRKASVPTKRVTPLQVVPHDSRRTR